MSEAAERFCKHAQILRRERGLGVEMSGMYCLDCGKMLKRDYKAREWIELGPVMDEGARLELRQRFGFDKPKPTGMRWGQRHTDP